MPKSNWPDWDVYVRDKCICVYCGLDGRTDIRIWRQLAIDHLIPTAANGSNTQDNKVVSCTRCNTLKSESNPTAPGTSVSFPLTSQDRQALIQRAKAIIEKKSEGLDESQDYEQMKKEIGA